MDAPGSASALDWDGCVGVTLSREAKRMGWGRVFGGAQLGVLQANAPITPSIYCVVPSVPATSRMGESEPRAVTPH
jgi:hypothetical protein